MHMRENDVTLGIPKSSYRGPKVPWIETCCLCRLYWRSACQSMGFLFFDNWVAGPDETDVVNVLDGD